MERGGKRRERQKQRDRDRTKQGRNVAASTGDSLFGRHTGKSVNFPYKGEWRVRSVVSSAFYTIKTNGTLKLSRSEQRAQETASSGNNVHYCVCIMGGTGLKFVS